VVVLAAAGFTLYLDFRVRSEFEGRRFALPARIFARPLELHAGLRIAQADVTDELREAGYREGAREGADEYGWFAHNSADLEIRRATACSGDAAAGRDRPSKAAYRRAPRKARRAVRASSSPSAASTRLTTRIACCAWGGAQAPGAGAGRHRGPKLPRIAASIRAARTRGAERLRGDRARRQHAPSSSW
jgi:hypothetical protein